MDSNDIEDEPPKDDTVMPVPVGEVNFLHQGISIIKQATEKDNEENYEEAFKLYKRGLKYLACASKYERNEKAKQLIKEKMTEYLDRAEKLQAYLTSMDQNNKKNEGDLNPTTIVLNFQKNKKKEETEKDRAIEERIVDVSKIKFDDVIGFENIKNFFKKNMDLENNFLNKTILLFGCAGVGKTILAKSLSTECGINFYSISSTSIISTWYGEAEINIKNIFKIALKKKPSIIFFDDFESIGNRDERESSYFTIIKNELLKYIYKIKNINNICFIAATNSPFLLSEELVYAFEKRIYLDLPNFEERKNLFRRELKNIQNNLKDFQFQELAELTNAYTGSDILGIVRNAAMEPIREIANSTHFKKIMNDLNEEKLIPCSPDDEKAVAMALADIDSNELYLPTVSMDNFHLNFGPSIGTEELFKQKQFNRNFGTSF